jgi:hypothetical protein
LVKANPRLADGIATFGGIFERGRSRLVQRTDERPRSNNHGSCYRIVRPDVARENGLVPARPRPDEIHNRDLELVGGAESAIVWLIDVARAVSIDEPVLNDLVVVRGFR